jgi:predicted DNA binding CopG/RHH family protein
MKKKLPRWKTDKEAEKFLEQDISDYIHKGNFKRVSFEFAPKDKSITIRVSNQLLKAVRQAAKSSGMNYQKLVREAIEQFLKNAA